VTAPSPFGLSDIGQIAIVVKDVDRATAYYRDVLGFKFLFGAPNLAFFQAGSVRLMLTPAEQAEFDHPASLIYFTVARIDEAVKALTARGVKFRDEAHVVHRTEAMELWMSHFHDCEQNTFILMETRAK